MAKTNDLQDQPAPGTGSTFEPEEQPKQTLPQNQTTVQVPGQPQLITLSPDQLNELVTRLMANQTIDKSPAPSMTPGIGLQTNTLGQVVGTVEKYDPNPELYPDPRERLFAEKRLRRFMMDLNYFLTWDIDSKPYPNKFGLSIVEPFFHMTLYANEFDDDSGEPTERAIVIQTIHFNEDKDIALEFAQEKEIPVTEESLKEVMDMARYERAKRWLFAIFFPERNFAPTNDAREEAIGGSVVKVVTKSNVKGFGNPTPKITDEELA